jgi:hypothetical protein
MVEMPPPPLARAHVTDPAKVRRIVEWFDLLGRVPPDQACVLPARIGPTVTFAFRNAGGRVVARAVAGDTEPSLTGCDSFQVAVGSRTVRVVGGDLLRRVERLLGIDLNPRTPANLACPSHPPRLGKANAPGPSRLVRPGATALLLCRYSGLNADPYPPHLARSALVRNRTEIAALIRRLDELRRVPHAIYSCPNDDGRRILLLFGYPYRSPGEQVLVSPTGCHFATNGRLSAWATLPLLHRLEELARPLRRQKPASPG